MLQAFVTLYFQVLEISRHNKYAITDSSEPDIKPKSVANTCSFLKVVVKLTIETRDIADRVVTNPAKAIGSKPWPSQSTNPPIPSPDKIESV